MLDAIILDTAPDPQASVIWMHGLGADGNDFVPIVPELGVDALPPIRFVFPNAPMRPVTLNSGYVMRAWYDVAYGDLEGRSRRVDEGGVRESQREIEALIAREKSRGVPAGRIVLAGFSQGGAMALVTGLRHAERLAGVMALSTYLLLADSLADEAAPANADVPIFYAHGTHDPLIPLELAQSSQEKLAALGYRVEWHEYRMQHSVCPEEVADIGAWLRRVLA